MNNQAFEPQLQSNEIIHFAKLHQIVNDARCVSNWRFNTVLFTVLTFWIIISIVAVEFYNFAMYPIVLLNIVLYSITACFASPTQYDESISALRKRKMTAANYQFLARK
ncbi:MAG: hypothetical protein V4585_18185 [Bacteroidota bacterium]